MLNYPKGITDNTIGNIQYRNNVVTGVIESDNGDNTYNVYVNSSTSALVNIPTTIPNPSFSSGDPVEILTEYGNCDALIIIGYAKKIVQEIEQIDMNVLVTTLDAYGTSSSRTWLEGRIEDIEGYENCLLRGFHYGETTSYGTDIYTTGSFAAGSYALSATGLSSTTTYNFCAYVYDADGDEQTGNNKSFTTLIGGHYLYSGCFETQTISKHNGISETILESFTAPGVGYVSGLTNDGTNLISGESIDELIYIHDGFSSGITNSFAAPGGLGGISGLAFDGTNLISSDWFLGKIYIHNGISSGISSSFDSPSTGSKFPRGLTVIGGNLVSMDANSDRIYVHNGVSSGIITSFPSPAASPNGLANDGTNLISGDNGTYGVEDDHFYLHNGVSSGVTTTFNAPSGYLRIQGLTYI